jgi:hypothetical protein
MIFFFALCGHSLLATRVLGRVRRAMEIDIPIPAFFEVPTVAGIVVQTTLAEERSLTEIVHANPSAVKRLHQP